MMKVSVCIATYNGEKFILHQLNSILPQLAINDEIIICDDASTDDTVKVINNIHDDRIKLFVNPVNHGHVYTFGKAIEYATNDIIFLSDQDDIWLENRINLYKSYFDLFDSLLITSNFDLLLNSKYKESEKRLNAKDSKNHFKNLICMLIAKRPYFGCAMAFKKELKQIILPIPKIVESHDLWIAIAANVIESNLHLDEVTVHRRLHGGNLTNSNRHLVAKLKTRLVFMIPSMMILFYRKLRYFKSG